VDEYAVKAAYLYHFAIYVNWPKQAPAGNDALIIGIYGKDPVDELAARLQTKKVHGKEVVVRRFASADELQACHILFIPATPAPGKEAKSIHERLATALKKMDGTLVVTETEGAARRGAAINFYLADDRVRFEINPSAARRAGLQVSSRLFQLGKIVED
jgi:hypothetical protein